MRKIPNFTLLRAFESAARLESFASAALELNLTPSAISHQVKELEEVFGKPLFRRVHRGVELLPEGRRLMEGLTRVLDALEASCADVSLAPDGQVLSLYCAPSFAVKWLGPRLPTFTTTHPDITIRMTSGAEPVDLLRAREVDVAISYGTAVERKGIEVIPLGSESIVPLCSPSVLNPEFTLHQQIARLTLIDSQLSRITWRDWFLLNRLELSGNVRQSFDRAALAISAAVDGMGVALESTRLAERELERGDLIEIGKGQFQRFARPTHFLSYRIDDCTTDKIDIFKIWLLNAVGVDV